MRPLKAWTLLTLALASIACSDSPTDVGLELYSYSAPTDIGDGLGGTAAATVGVDASQLQLMVREIQDNVWPNIHSVLVYRGGALVLEEYFSGVMRSDSTFRDFARDTLHDMYSVSKSFTSAVVGLAMASGDILSVDQPVSDFFPEYLYLGGSLASGELKVRHLLSMSAGLEWDEGSTAYTDPANSHFQMRQADDPIEFVFSRVQAAAPGTVFRYNTGLTALLGELVARATSEPFYDYIARELFGPLGIDEFRWLDGYYNGDLAFAGGGLQLRPRDMVKFGAMYLNGGMWQGAQVVPVDWVQESTSAHVPIGGYGYLWWLGSRPVGSGTEGFFRALGLGGQHIFVFPGVDLVVAFTSNGSGTGPYELMDDYILSGLF